MAMRISHRYGRTRVWERNAGAGLGHPVYVVVDSNMDELPLDEYLAAAGCDSEKLTRQVSGTKVLAGIARKLNKWKEVRPWLDLDEADEDAITHDYQTTERRRSALKACHPAPIC